MQLAKIIRFIINHPLNRGSYIGAVIRFIKWQIGSRLVPGDVLINWVNDTRLIMRPGETGLTQNLYCGLQDFYEMSYLLHVLRREDLFIDVGANVGAYTILACGAIEAYGCIFEPVPSTYSRLMNNIRLNNIDLNRVNCINAAIGDRFGEVRFISDLNTMNRVALKGEHRNSDLIVKLATLDSFLGSVNPNVLKIDVEGYEMPVLLGAVSVLEKESLHSIIIELNGSGEKYGVKEEDILMLLEKSGFKPYTYDPFSRSLISIEEKNKSSNNTLFVRNKDFVLSRLKSAPRFKISGKLI